MNPAPEFTFAPGVKVRYKYSLRMVGVLDRPVRGGRGRKDPEKLWWVFWDGGTRNQAYEDNLEILGATS